MLKKKSSEASTKSRSAGAFRGTKKINETAKRPRKLRAVVGIGASAGGLDALTLLLKHLPAKTGMAFVYVQHLDPTHESMLTPILSRISPIPVKEAVSGTQVAPNTLYIIPPNKSIRIVHGALRLKTRQGTTSGLNSIDIFFDSLAKDQKDRSIGIILSGNASDGTLGLAAIKEAGGITFAQREDSAKYGSMPRNAIALGDVDHILSPTNIALELEKISLHAHVARLPSGGKPATEGGDDKQKVALGEILSLLSTNHGVNFTQYKPMTLRRRIARRMVLHKISTFSKYADFLKTNSEELDRLFQDMLINVTEFFRDKEVYEYLQSKTFPKLLKEHPKNNSVRMWVAGCASGEEVYSLAIAFIEYQQKHKLSVPLQIFGSDLSESCIKKARRGVYPSTIKAKVSKERLDRYFVRTDEGYQVTSAIREMCIFAKQNIINDPPFSRMDLVSCRNVLIYLDQSAQKRVIHMFHYALQPFGYLVLGKSEGVGGFTDLFEIDNKKHRTYKKRFSVRGGHLNSYATPEGGTKDTVTQIKTLSHPPLGSTKSSASPQILNEADLALLSSSLTPACVVVDAQFEVLQLRGDLSPYLQLPSGKASLNLLKITKEDLELELRGALLEAKKKGHTVFLKDINVNGVGTHATLNIEVTPMKIRETGSMHLLVVFQQSKPVKNIEMHPGLGTVKSKNTSRERRHQLERERLLGQLANAKEQLRSALETQEGMNEEFQSANEEILSSNEELQSFNEEIQTTKEEIQSTNEELTTVNEELQVRNVDLGTTNSDLLNVLDSVNVPIIIVDRELLIRRVTPITKKSFRIITSDVGRSITDIRLPANFPDLKILITEVMRTTKPKNEEVSDEEGNWYTLWVRPYYAPNHKIDGAIVTLIDINSVKLAQLAQEESNAYITGILGTMREPLVILDNKFHILNANLAFHKTFGKQLKETVGTSLYVLGNKEWDTPKIRELLEKVLLKKNAVEDFEVDFNSLRTGRMTLRVNAHRLLHKDGGPAAILLVMEDITERKFVQERTDTFMSMASHELKTPATTIKMLAQILQKRFENDSDKTLTQYLGKMVEQINHLAQISSDLMDVSGIRAKKFVINEIVFDLSILASEVVENCQLLTKTHVVHFRGKEAAWIRGDRERIGRVLINLIVNAIKYSPNASDVIVTLAATEKKVKLSVQDFGIGISPKNQQVIFEHSTQVEKLKGQQGAGLGLGLYISSSIIRRHNSEIVVKSTVGKGSTFSFVFPIEKP